MVLMKSKKISDDPTRNHIQGLILQWLSLEGKIQASKSETIINIIYSVFGVHIIA